MKTNITEQQLQDALMVISKGGHVAFPGMQNCTERTIKSYGKVEAVVEMYRTGAVDPGPALKQIVEIVEEEP